MRAYRAAETANWMAPSCVTVHCPALNSINPNLSSASVSGLSTILQLAMVRRAVSSAFVRALRLEGDLAKRLKSICKQCFYDDVRIAAATNLYTVGRDS
jgi:hypothetical protein